MLNLIARTKKDLAEVSNRITSYFGTGGLGLDDVSEGHVRHFTGGGGHVMASIRADDAETVIDIEAREFEEQVRQCARETA